MKTIELSKDSSVIKYLAWLEHVPASQTLNRIIWLDMDSCSLWRSVVLNTLLMIFMMVFIFISAVVFGIGMAADIWMHYQYFVYGLGIYPEHFGELISSAIPISRVASIVGLGVLLIRLYYRVILPWWSKRQKVKDVTEPARPSAMTQLYSNWKEKTCSRISIKGNQE